MNWDCLPFFLAATLINKGKGELLLIISIPLKDTAQITETRGGGGMRESRTDGRSLGSGRTQGLPGGGHPVKGYYGCSGHMQTCQQGPLLTPALLP